MSLAHAPRRLHLWAVAVGLATIAACGGGLPVATPADAARAQVTMDELQHGRALTAGHCGGCHRPPLPTEHTAREWPVMLEEMSGRAHLDASQRRLIEMYLVTLASR